MKFKKTGTQMNPVRDDVSNGAETQRRKYFFNLGGENYLRKSASYLNVVKIYVF